MDRRTNVIGRAILALGGAAAFSVVALAAPTAQTKALPRVFVHTDVTSDDGAVRDRQQSVKDLRKIFADRKKTLVVVDDEESADVDVEVVERTTTIPKIRIGIMTPGPVGPARVAHLRVKVTRGDKTMEFTNKTSPFENQNGWASAADDIARQIEKWIAGAR